MPPRVDRMGQRFGHLLVVGEAPNQGGRAAWLCLCNCGSQVVVKAGNLVSGNTTSCGCSRVILGAERSGPNHPLWQGQVKYAAAHIRVARAKGPASSHECVDCGGPARDWSYEGGDPNELVEMVKGSPRRFSLNVDLYHPRCRSCHLSRDFGVPV